MCQEFTLNQVIVDNCLSRSTIIMLMCNADYTRGEGTVSRR